jgi:glycerol-3-phosphate dehydrogenase
MQRDLSRLWSPHFDLLVVGGGIYGLIVACDASMRGLAVALVDRGDFGGASSFNHLRTIHGGLRYLQTVDIHRARESVRERRILATIAPAALAPLPFVLPLTKSDGPGPAAMRAAFLLDRVIAADRNDGVPASHAVPPGRVLGPDAARSRFPGLRAEDLTAAAVWHDYVTTEPHRLTLAWALEASRHGAVLANYVEATRLVVEAGRVVGIEAIDRQSGQLLSVRARCTVNATGAAIDRLLTPIRARTSLPMMEAMNLVTRCEAPGHAIGARTRAGKTYFMVPAKGRAIFGTWESARAITGRPGAPDITAFLGELSEAFPGFGIGREAVTLVQRGFVPAVHNPDGSFRLAGSEQVHDQALAGIEGLISVAGTKYTTARGVAARVVDLVMAKLERPPVICRTDEQRLPILVRHGDEGLRAAARDEMVVTLADAVMRRTSLAALEHPGREVLAHLSAVVGGVLGWDDSRQQMEIAAVEALYGTSNA